MYCADWTIHLSAPHQMHYLLICSVLHWTELNWSDPHENFTFPVIGVSFHTSGKFLATSYWHQPQLSSFLNTQEEGRVLIFCSSEGPGNAMLPFLFPWHYHNIMIASKFSENVGKFKYSETLRSQNAWDKIKFKEWLQPFCSEFLSYLPLKNINVKLLRALRTQRSCQNTVTTSAGKLQNAGVQKLF
jgi:hypothetical protein